MQDDAGGLRLRAHQAPPVMQELAQVEHRLAERQVVGLELRVIEDCR